MQRESAPERGFPRRQVRSRLFTHIGSCRITSRCLEMLDEQQLQKLLRIKRFEQPPPGYFDRTLIEFHRRLREELLRRSASLIWWERFVSGLGTFRVPSYAYGAAFAVFLAVATIVGSGLWTPYNLSANRGALSGPEAQGVVANRLA